MVKPSPTWRELLASRWLVVAFRHHMRATCSTHVSHYKAIPWTWHFCLRETCTAVVVYIVHTFFTLTWYLILQETLNSLVPMSLENPRRGDPLTFLSNFQPHTPDSHITTKYYLVLLDIACSYQTWIWHGWTTKRKALLTTGGPKRCSPRKWCILESTQKKKCKKKAMLD